MTTEANIEIIRDGEKLSSISVIMPTWNKIEDSGILSITIPLFGLKTFAKDLEDAENAVSEAVQCFCISAEKFGQGIEAELQALGWVRSDNENKHSLLTYSVASSDFVLEQIMETGEQFAHSLAITA